MHSWVGFFLLNRKLKNEEFDSRECCQNSGGFTVVFVEDEEICRLLWSSEFGIFVVQALDLCSPETGTLLLFANRWHECIAEVCRCNLRTNAGVWLGEDAAAGSVWHLSSHWSPPRNHWLQSDTCCQRWTRHFCYRTKGKKPAKLMPSCYIRQKWT